MTGLSILDRIVDKKKEEVALLKAKSSIATLRRQALEQAPPRDLFGSLKTNGRVPIIAEIKKASPSAGPLSQTLNVANQARAYQEGGAVALSVLTDGPFFNGSLADLSEARSAVQIPVLRKDFIVDLAQIYEARLAGADAVLLIVAALNPTLLAELYQAAREVGLMPLIEVHQAEELEPALSLKPPLIGINNRNLSTMKVDLETCVKLRPLIPEGVVVAESGINGPEDIRRLRSAGLHAFLIGTTLMRAADPAAELGRLCMAERC